MRVKRYVVNAVPEALAIIRSELGKDAVILSTKDIYVGGFLGMFRTKRVEVIAAAETAPPQAKPVAGTAIEAAVREELKYAVAAAEREAKKEPAQQHTARQQEHMATAVPFPQKPAGKQQQDSIVDELRQVKEMVYQLARSSNQGQLPKPLAALRERLLGQEVDSHWAEQLLAEVQADAAYAPEATAEQIWPIAKQLIVQWLEPYCDRGIRPETKIVHFVGPTGVGKTTSIAKLAAEQTLKHNRKVGFITSDTYRIAAVEQLRTYANILNVPMEVVSSPAELNRAFKHLEDRELIFMDTAGRNFRNELYVSEVNSLLVAKQASETYLVFSLTGRTKDMAAVAESFAKFGIHKVLFTKLDETDACGAILNIVLEYKFKPAYIAKGQNVPDDIEPFNSAVYAERLIGEVPYE